MQRQSGLSKNTVSETETGIDEARRAKLENLAKAIEPFEQLVANEIAESENETAALKAQVGTCTCGSTRFGYEALRIDSIANHTNRPLDLDYVECRGCRRVHLFARAGANRKLTAIDTRSETGL